MRKTGLYIILLILSSGAVAQQPDTTSVSKTTEWKLSSDYTGEIPVSLDTAFSLFHRYRVTDRFSDFSAYPGNYGLPLYQINFFDRDWQPDNYLKYYYLPYMFTPGNTRFINTHVPFTEMKWTFGGSRAEAEQTFRVRHSQNVNNRLNFGLIFDIVYSLGQYGYQKAVNKNFLLHSSYNGDRYTAYFSAAINNQLAYENGGITDKQYLQEYSTADVPVNLNKIDNAQSNLRNRYIMFVQRYNPGGKRDTVTGEMINKGPVTFSHIGIYEWNRKSYTDDSPTSLFYDTVFISSTATYDSLSQGQLSNTLRIDLAAGSGDKFNIGAGAGIRSEIRSYGQIVPGDSLTRPDTVGRHQSSLVLTGKIFNNIGRKFGWQATGDLWFQGYRAGDFVVKGHIFKDFETSKGTLSWNADATVANYTPSYWYYSWGSNNFLWQNDFGREFRLIAGSSIDWPGRNFNIRFNYAGLNNFIFFGNDATPQQFGGGLSVLSLSLRKEFSFWKFHLDNTVLAQKSSNEDVLSLPLATARSAFFFDHLFRFRSTNGELYFQAGAEAMIHTPYYALGYMPATGRYFSQWETKTGNYPFVNLFLNLKVKRTRVFIMYDHINSGFSGYDYFLIPSYPMNVRMLRYGLAWTFYD